MAKDFLNNELFVGDKVAFFQINYRNFLIGEITKIGPKKVTITHKETNTCKTKTMQFHEQVVKIEEADKYKVALLSIVEELRSSFCGDYVDIEISNNIVMNMAEEALGLETTKGPPFL
jgi:hypothetical protein